jgi:hypothetical protein
MDCSTVYGQRDLTLGHLNYVLEAVWKARTMNQKGDKLGGIRVKNYGL